MYSIIAYYLAHALGLAEVHDVRPAAQVHGGWSCTGADRTLDLDADLATLLAADGGCFPLVLCTPPSAHAGTGETRGRYYLGCTRLRVESNRHSMIHRWAVHI